MLILSNVRILQEKRKEIIAIERLFLYYKAIL